MHNSNAVYIEERKLSLLLWHTFFTPENFKHQFSYAIAKPKNVSRGVIEPIERDGIITVVSKQQWIRENTFHF